MSGARLLLDTNAIVALLNGSSSLNGVVGKADWIGISVISRLEFLAYSKLSPEDEELFLDFCERIKIIGLAEDNFQLLDTTTRYRREYRLKLPDAIVAATAVTNDATLVTSDNDFKNVPELSIINPMSQKTP